MQEKNAAEQRFVIVCWGKWHDESWGACFFWIISLYGGVGAVYVAAADDKCRRMRKLTTGKRIDRKRRQDRFFLYYCYILLNCDSNKLAIKTRTYSTTAPTQFITTWLI